MLQPATKQTIINIITFCQSFLTYLTAQHLTSRTGFTARNIDDVKVQLQRVESVMQSINQRNHAANWFSSFVNQRPQGQVLQNSIGTQRKVLVLKIV